MKRIALVVGAILAVAVVAITSGEIAQASLSSIFVGICGIKVPMGSIYLESVTSSGDVYFSQTNGQTWTHRGSIGTTGVVGLCCIYYPPGNIYFQAVTATGAVYFSADLGSTWVYKGNVGASDVTSICSIVIDDPEQEYTQVVLYVTTGCGEVYSSGDFGERWFYIGDIVAGASATEGSSWGRIKAAWPR